MERKLNAMQIDPEVVSGPMPAEAKRVEVDGSVRSAKDKAEEILKNLKSKLEFAQTGENAEEHFLRELS